MQESLNIETLKESGINPVGDNEQIRGHLVGDIGCVGFIQWETNVRHMA